MIWRGCMVVNSESLCYALDTLDTLFPVIQSVPETEPVLNKTNYITTHLAHYRDFQIQHPTPRNPPPATHRARRHGDRLRDRPHELHLHARPHILAPPRHERLLRSTAGYLPRAPDRHLLDPLRGALRAHETAEKERLREEAEARGESSESDTDAQTVVGVKGGGSASVEVREEVEGLVQRDLGESPLRSKSDVSTEDEWEKVSENEKDK
ncbi:hypothetical protein V497_02367 [Pseudogymnoascus sp. VKM F-4516 (FW-969)]|nr:hypothetical protein V490_07776 [Pseudogymnoascus sp. VKM F-3557]KFY62446.1 hypothetical protein V497_02367 [Pseudogymnoascus sp. VKM F-4516 (FW-969)]